MAGTIIDQLTTIFDFKTDTSGINKADAAMDGFRHKTEKANETLEFFKRGIEVIGIALGLEKINEWANEWDNAQNKLRSTGLTGTELADTMQKLKAISKESGGDIEGLSELYQQLNVSLGETLDKSQLLQVTGDFSKMFAVNGTSAQNAKASMSDLSKALENQTVNWMELNRGLMDIPALNTMVKKQFKDMGTTLKDAMEGNKFSTQEFVKILLKLSPEINQQFRSTATTVTRASASMITSFEDFFSTLRQNTGITDFLISGLNAVGKTLDWLTKFMGTHANTMKAIGITLASIFTMIGIRMGIAFAPFLLSIAPIALAIGGLILVLDDFITFMKGGNSVIGSFVNWFNKSNEIVKVATLALGGMVAALIAYAATSKIVAIATTAMNVAMGIFNGLIAVLDVLLSPIVLIFLAIAAVLGLVIFSFTDAGKKFWSAIANYFIKGINWAWDKFKSFKDWLISAFVNIGSIILKPFKTLFDDIMGLINRIMNNSIIKSGLKLFGIDLSESKPKEAKTLSLAAQQDKILGLTNTNMMTTQNHAMSSATHINDNSHIVLNVSVPEGTTKDIATKIVSDALTAHKQTYRIGAMNNDSKIAR